MTTIILLFLTFIHPAPQTCLSYEPDVVTLTGTIRRHTFPGPPNFESIAKGDQAETVWLLHLAKPICVNASSDWEKATGVSALELVLTKYDKSLVNHRVTISGTLFHASTAHHHTKVLLTVKEIRK